MDLHLHLLPLLVCLGASCIAGQDLVLLDGAEGLDLEPLPPLEADSLLPPGFPVVQLNSTDEAQDEEALKTYWKIINSTAPVLEEASTSDVRRTPVNEPELISVDSGNGVIENGNVTLNEDEFYVEGVGVAEGVPLEVGAIALTTTTPAPIMPECEPKLDIVLMLDTSGSVEKIFKEHVRWAVALVEALPIEKDSVRVAAIQFAGFPLAEFSLGTYPNNAKDIQTHLANIKFQSGITRTGYALRKAEAELFRSDRGARETARKVIVLFSDGSSTDDVLKPAQQVRELKGVTIYVVVGGDKRGDNETNKIAGGPKNVFGPDDLPRLREALISEVERSKTCSRIGPVPQRKVSGKSFAIETAILEEPIELNGKGAEQGFELLDEVEEEASTPGTPITSTTTVTTTTIQSSPTTTTTSTASAPPLEEYSDDVEGGGDGEPPQEETVASPTNITSPSTTTTAATAEDAFDVDAQPEVSQQQKSTSKSKSSTTTAVHLKVKVNGQAGVSSPQKSITTQSTPSPPPPTIRPTRLHFTVKAQSIATAEAGAEVEEVTTVLAKAIVTTTTAKPRTKALAATAPSSGLSSGPPNECPIDWLFIIDSSGSIQKVYQEQKDYLESILKKIPQIDAEANRVALLQFAGGMQSTVWGYDAFNIHSSLMGAFAKLRLMTGTTYIGRALESALALLQSRRRHVPSITVLLTDGFSQDDAIQAGRRINRLTNNEFYAVSISELNNEEYLAAIVGGDANVFVGQKRREELRRLLIDRIHCQRQQT